MHRSYAEELAEIQKSWSPAERRRRRLMSATWIHALCHLLEIHVPTKRLGKTQKAPAKTRRLAAKLGAKSTC